MKKKHYKGYVSLKEARAVARSLANEIGRFAFVKIYEESDGSFSVGQPCDDKAVFRLAVDKSGARFTIKRVNNPYFGKRQEYVRIK